LEIAGDKGTCQHLFGWTIARIRFFVTLSEFFWRSMQHAYVLGLPPYASFPT
jgi:hypothetical protein